MTPDLLSKISSIVNSSFVPKNLTEVEQPGPKAQANKPEGSTQEDPKTNTTRFNNICKNLSFKKFKVRETKPYTFSVEPNFSKMKTQSYMMIKGDKSQLEKLNSQSVNIKAKNGDFLFKDSDGQTRVVQKAALNKEYSGNVGGPLKHKKDTMREVARYTGPDVEFASGTQKRTLRKGEYLVRDGGHYVNISAKVFGQTFEI
jgi:hypothetical protein